MSRYNSPAIGVLDGRGSPQRSQGVYVHNPYWYEGFDPRALSGASSPYQNYGYNYGYNVRLEDQPPYPWSQYHWSERIQRPLRSLRTNTYEIQRHKPQSPPSYDNSSDQTLGYSDSEKGSDDRDSQLETQLIQCIVDYFGDCKGSLPSERVQNVIKKDYAELYEAVVVSRYRKKWHKFLQHCSDTFQLFTRPAQPAPNQDYCWRIRLVNNTDWEEADLQDEEYRARRDKELLDKVHSILSNAPGKQSLMIDVINEMNKEAKEDGGKDEGDSRKARKIRAGDLKRLMRKCNSNFTILEFQDGESQKRATYMKLVDESAQ